MIDAVQEFAAEVRRGDADLNLGRAALLIAAGEYPHLEIDLSITLLDEMAAGVRELLSEDATPQDMAFAMRRRLFKQFGFRGNDQDYYDPRNSYLNDVLLRRTGIPISLAVVYIEIGRRIGLDVAGVSYPRHFLVKYRDGANEWIVDPFHGGEEFSGEQLRMQMIEVRGKPRAIVDYYLSAVTRRQVLSRMLLNLKEVYREREDWQRALRTQEYLLALTPWSFDEIRDRGKIRASLGDTDGAIADLETYLNHIGKAADVTTVEQMIRDLRE